jgi:hypothetical protein
MSQTTDGIADLMDHAPFRNWTPTPEWVRERRWDGVSPLDMWDPLVWDDDEHYIGLKKALSGFICGLGGSHPARDASGAGTYVAKAPQYIPYETAAAPCDSRGAEIFARALETALSPVATEAVMSHPLAVPALLANLVMRHGLLEGEGARYGRALDDLAAAAPPKGGEVHRKALVYRRNRGAAVTDANVLAIRDFFASMFSWWFVRPADGRIIDLAGSLLCMESAADYVKANDDAGGGPGTGYSAYARAASEGIGCLAGETADRALREAVHTFTYMKVKDSLRAITPRISDAGEFLTACGMPLSAEEYLAARWWDGAFLPFYRLIFGCDPFWKVADSQGRFLSVDRCDAIRRTIDASAYYNDVIDLVCDVGDREPFNQLALAIALRGPASLYGFADAIAQITDDVLVCRCGNPGHQTAAEMSMGSCVSYVVEPRYRARKQLRAYAQISNQHKAVFEWPEPGHRLDGITHSRLRSGYLVHTNTWEPAWYRDESALTPGEKTASLAGRAARRVLPDANPEDLRACADTVEPTIVACDTLVAPVDLADLAEGWSALFTAAVNHGAPEADRTAVANMVHLTQTAWRYCIVGQDMPGQSDEEIGQQMDRALRTSYRLPAHEGYRLRRAFVGTLSCMVELSGLNPYARLTDGVYHTLMTAE